MMLNGRETGLNTPHAQSVKVELYGLVVSFLALACLSLSARMYVRIKAGVYGMEDWWLVAALVFMFLKAGVIIVMIENGLGLEAENLQPSNFEAILKMLYASTIEYCFGMGFVKLSILIMYRRIFDTRSMRIAVNILGVANIIWVILFAALAALRCIPVQRAWDLSVPGKCLNATALYTGNAIPNIVMDLVMVAIPIYPVSKLRLPLSQRIALIGIFMLGGIVCVVSIYRVTTFAALDVANLAFTLRDPTVLGNVEMATAVVSACLPTLRPLYSAFMRAVGLSKGNYSKQSCPKGGDRSRSSTLSSYKSRKGKSAGFAVIGDDDRLKLDSKPLPPLPAEAKETDDEASMVSVDVIHVRHDVDIESAGSAPERPHYSGLRV